MATMVLMPQMGVSEESAMLAKYLVKVGDTVKPGAALFSLETGKSSFECLAEVEGTVLALFGAEGDEINVGVPVLAIGAAGEKVDAPAGAAAEAPKAAPEAAAPVAAPAVAEAPKTEVTKSADGFKASPRARMLASEAGVDISAASPTGPDGRVIERDVKTLMKSGAVAAAPAAAAEAPKAAASAAPVAAGPEFEDKAVSKIRKVIAENMHKSLSEMAQLTLNRTFDATSIMAFRQKAKNAKGFGLEDVTLNDFVLYAVARTLPEFPDLNAWFMGDKMRFFSTVNLGCAVDTPRGLMVPVLPHAEKMTLLEISKAVRAKAEACRAGTIPPAELASGSFTISNLGASGIESFTPVINPPQTAILGVDTIMLRPREVNGEIVYYKAMGLSLTFDHRAVDGAPAARFLKTLAERLENFELTLAL